MWNRYNVVLKASNDPIEQFFDLDKIEDAQSLFESLIKENTTESVYLIDFEGYQVAIENYDFPDNADDASWVIAKFKK